MLNLKMILYLENSYIMEKTRFFNPRHLVAARHCTNAKTKYSIKMYGANL